MVFKHPEIKIGSDDAVINIIRFEVKERTKPFDFFIAEKFDSFERTTDKEHDALEIQEFMFMMHVKWTLCAKTVFRNLDPPMKISSEEQEERLKKVMTLMIFMTNNNDDRQSDADNCEESEDEDEVEDRMCECRRHCLG